MAKISGVKTTVSAPSEINIPLIRADHHATANIFRVFFEFFLACFSGTLGTVLAMAKTPTVYWVMLAILGIAALASVGCSLYYGRSSSASE